jgi:hypothetical protein
LSAIAARTVAPSRSPKGSAVAPTPQDAVELLGGMLDLRGSVELASLLDRPVPPPTPLPAALDARRRALIDDLDAIVAAQDGLDLRKMPRVPRLDARSVLAALSESGALEAPREPFLGRAVRSLFAPITDAARRARTRSEAAIDDLVRDVIPELAAASPRGAWVLRVDGLLLRSTGAREEALVERALAGVEGSFARALAPAIEALPPDDEAAVESAVAGWLHGAGFFARHLALAATWVRACVERRVARMKAIAEACGEAQEEGSDEADAQPAREGEPPTDA